MENKTMHELRTILLTVTIMAASVFTFGSAWASPEPGQHHHHHHGSAAELNLNLNDGERWATDESLRAGMLGIFKAFSAAHDDYLAGQLDPEGADVLADQVDEQVNFIFANCNLPSDADVELHKLLAATFGSAATLRESNDVHNGLHELHQVLKTYGEYFDHPGWSAEIAH